MAYRELSRVHKKRLLFLSPRNPFWSLLLAPQPTSDEIAKFCGLARSTFSTWKRTLAVGDDSIQKAFSAVEEYLGMQGLPLELHRNAPPTDPVAALRIRGARGNKQHAIDVFNQFKEVYYSDNIGIYETGQILGMTISECQMTIDQLIYTRMPLFSGVYYESEGAANAAFRRYGGIYLLWVERGDTWLQCPLRVRYKLEINGLFTIRCKLNAPIISEGPGHWWEYDGFLTERDNRNYWIFEKRDKESRYDHFYFITNKGISFKIPNGNMDNRQDLRLTLRGQYLSAGQDQQQTIVNGAIFVQSQLIEQKAEVHFMHNEARVLNLAEATETRKHYDDLNEYLSADPIQRMLAGPTRPQPLTN